jgi:hypothetical protein
MIENKTASLIGIVVGKFIVSMITAALFSYGLDYNYIRMVCVVMGIEGLINIAKKGK